MLFRIGSMRFGGVSVVAGTAVLALHLAAQAAYAQPWVPPTGVPMPTFGVRETAPAPPSPWTAETRGFYYVDNTHPAATDAAVFGTPGRPRRSIPTGVDPGSVVEVHGGPYVSGTDTAGGGNGTAAAPIFYKGVGKPILQSSADRRNFGVWGSYTIIEGFTFVNRQVALVGHHTAVRDCEVRDMPPLPGGAAIYTAHTSDVVILRNLIHHNGNNNYPVENDIHGVLVAAGALRVWVVDNEMYANGGSSIQVNSLPTNDPLAKLVFIARNRMHEEGETGIAIKSGEDVVISQNELWGFRPTNYPHSGSDGTAILIDDQNAWNGLNNRMWILFNYVHNSTVGIRTQNYAAVIGNIVRDVQNAGVLTWGSHDVHIEHNTFYNACRGLERFGGEVGFKVIFVNNIVGPRTCDDIKLTGNSVSTSVMATSLFNTPARITWGIMYSPLSSFMAGHACVGCREGDPRFVDPANANFKLGAGSPATGTATPSSAYDIFQQLYGINIKVDFAGRTRPGLDGKWDMGALETDGVGAPAPPTNVRIIR